MNLYVPEYSKKGFVFSWENGFSITCKISGSVACIEANKEGLVSLARHLLELSQDNAPTSTHIHLDEYNSLEDGSSELVIIKVE